MIKIYLIFSVLVFFFLITCSNSNNPNESNEDLSLSLYVDNLTNNQIITNSYDLIGHVDSASSINKIEISIDNGQFITVSTNSFKWNYQINSTLLSNSLHTLTIKANNVKGIINSLTISFYVNNDFDLKAQSLDEHSDTYKTFLPISFTYTINLDSFVLSSSINVLFFMSQTNQIDSSLIPLGNVVLSGLQNSSTYSSNVLLNIPNDVSVGNYYFGMIIDPSNTLNDSNFQNNSIFSSSTHYISTGKRWLVMVYMDGDNNLDEYSVTNFNQLEGINVDNYSLDILVLWDRDQYATWSDTRMYKISYDPSGASNTSIVSQRIECAPLGITTGTTPTELDMGSMSTLQTFVNFCKTQYTSLYSALIIWDHGDGWTKKSNISAKPLFKGACYDDTNGGYLSIVDIQNAISGKSLDVIGFDCCLMGMTEVAYQFKDDCKYLIASEENIPAYGWNYLTVFDNFLQKPSQTPSEFCKSAVWSYEDYYSAGASVSLSAVELEKLSSLSSAVNELVNNLTGSLTSSEIKALRSSITWGYNYGYGGFPHMDLLDYVSQASIVNFPGSIAVKNILSNAIISEWHASNSLTSNGLAIYYPQSTNDIDTLYSTTTSHKFMVDTMWDTFCTNLSNIPD